MIISSAAYIQTRIRMHVWIVFLLNMRLSMLISSDTPPTARIARVAFMIERLGRAATWPIGSRRTICTASHLANIFYVGVIYPIDRHPRYFKQDLFTHGLYNALQGQYAGGALAAAPAPAGTPWPFVPRTG